MSSKKIKVEDRVKRADGNGCYGLVKDVRTEITANTLDTHKEKALLVSVLWDNGTFSYLTPDNLEVVKE